MTKALISPSEAIESGFRIVAMSDTEFPVAPPLYWVDAVGEIDPDLDFYEPGVGFARRPDPVVEEPSPTPGPTLPPAAQITPLQFIDRFTGSEQLSIAEATLQNAQVKLWYDKLLAASFVDLTDPRLSAGLDALVSFGLITPERKVEVMAETIPVAVL